MSQDIPFDRLGPVKLITAQPTQSENQTPIQYSVYVSVTKDQERLPQAGGAL